MIQLKTSNGNVDLSQKLMKGDDGGYYIPAVDKDGNLTWTPSEEYMEPINPANILGPAGVAGAPGVYVGYDEPTDPTILVWLKPDGEPSDYVMTETEVKTYIDESLEEVEDGTY